MPRPRKRDLPAVETLLAEIREAGVEGAPQDGPRDALAALLLLACDLAQLKKRVEFAPDFSWSDPSFTVLDARLRVPIRYAPLEGDDVCGALVAGAARLPPGLALLALDCRASSVREFDLGHRLFGEVTLFQHRSRPEESADPRIHRAAEAGWGKVLKEHNLVPGRGLVVLDEHHGLFLTEPALERLAGIFVLFEDASWRLWWNPVSGLDPEVQYWMSWGDGTGPASAWREVMRYGGADEGQV